MVIGRLEDLELRVEILECQMAESSDCIRDLIDQLAQMHRSAQGGLGGIPDKRGDDMDTDQ